MTQLRKLILVDSFAASRIREIRLDGHVHISGRNGRGKTTLIRLIPLFYGEQPSRIIRPTGNVVRNLRDFLLSRTTSFIAFEYENASGIKLAILHYSGDSPQYHLADGPYTKDIFVENNTLIEGRRLNARLRVLERNPTGALGVLDYRMIIQGTAGRLGRNDLRGLIQRFALMSSKSRLAGIERISSGMFSKDITFGDLKRMAASVAFDEEDKSISLSLSRKEIEGFVPDFHAYLAAMALEPRYLTANAASIRERIERGRAQEAAARLQAFLNALVRNHDSLRGNLEAAESELKRIQGESQSRLSEFDVALNANSRSQEQISEDIADIDRQEADWKSKDIDERVRLSARIPDLENDQRALEEQQHALTAKADSVARKFQAILAKQKERSEAAVTKAREESRKHLDTLTTEKEAIRDLREIERAQLRKRGDRESEIANAEWQEALEQARALEAQIASLQPDPVLEQTVREAKADLSERAGATAAARNASEQARLHQVKAESYVKDMAHRLDECERIAANTNQRLQRLLALQNAGDKTLLHFLRQQLPHWHEDIAKVVRDDLLLREDLTPQLADGETLYGLAVDLKRIDAGTAASEAALRVEIDAARHLHEGSLAKVSKATDALSSAQNDAAASKALLDEHQAHFEGAVDDEDCAKALLVTSQKQRDGELDQRREALRRQRTEADARAEAKKSAMRQAKQRIDADAEQMETRFAKTIAAVVDREMAEAERLSKELAELEAQARQSREGIEMLRLAELAEEGVDTKALKLLEFELGKIQAKLRTARDSLTSVEEFRRWKSNVLPRRDTYHFKIKELEQIARRLRDDRHLAELSFKAQIENQNEVVSRQESALRAMKARRASAEEALRSRPAILEMEPATVPDETALTWELAEILSAFDTASSAQRRLRIEFRRELGVLVSGFRKPEFLQTKVGEFAAYFGDSPIESADKTLGLLGDWYATAHLQQRDVLAGKIRNGCGILVGFRDAMRSFQSSIAGLSKELHDSLESDMVFEAIRSIQLRLSALVERRSYWDSLGRVVLEHEKWEIDGHAGLPHSDLLTELQDFARHLPDGGLTETPESLIDLEIEVDDRTEKKRVRTESDLRQVSSNGLSYLVLCLIFVAFANRARRGNPIWLTWALDEIGTIDDGNSRALLQMLDRNQIRLISASPDARESLQLLFNFQYEIQSDFEICRFATESELALGGAGDVPSKLQAGVVQ